MLITTQAQPPLFLITSTGAAIKVKEQETGHKWLGCMLSPAGSKNAILEIDYHLQSAGRIFFANKWCIHQKQIENLQCHRDTNRLFWSWAPMHPPCRYGQTWRKKKLDIIFRRMIRTCLELETGSAGGIRGTKLCMSGINACEKWWGHVSMSHENMGRNLRF